MVQTFTDAKILILDDQTIFLVSAKEFFGENGIEISTAQNCENVIQEGRLGNYDIILSDLDLRNISDTESGLSVLKRIRDHNNSIFLGLYTGYEKTLSNNQRRDLADNNIKIYKKDDPDAFLENLISDYEIYINDKDSEKENATMFFELIKKDVLLHLKGISNQSVQIPISNMNRTFTVKELYEHVYQNSKIGRSFMVDWYETMNFINQIQNKKNDGKKSNPIR